MPKLGN